MPRAKASGPTVWCFVGAADLWAITLQEDGGNLPPDHGPWRYLRSVRLEGRDPDEREAELLVTAYGYCCFQPFASNEPFIPPAAHGR